MDKEGTHKMGGLCTNSNDSEQKKKKVERFAPGGRFILLAMVVQTLVGGCKIFSNGYS